jgi:hypothetical protein
MLAAALPTDAPLERGEAVASALTMAAKLPSDFVARTSFARRIQAVGGSSKRKSER